jgi:voltage-gated potassium channel
MASDRSFRQRLRATVLEANTPAGKIYNLVIFGAILLSVVVLLFEPNPLGNSALQQTEVLWIDLVQDSCLAVFAADFVMHLAVVPSPRKYLFSFTGLIDLSAVLFFFVPQVRSELLLWVFKFGRILRVFKLLKFIDEAKLLAQALRGSARTISVFLFFVFLLQVVLGYAIFVIESAGPNSQFDTVSKGLYWAIVTMTTVGYGDVVPQTALGRLLASVVMMLGFGIIAIPTGILTVSGMQHHQKQLAGVPCHQCGRQGHRRDAQHCDQCGASLGESESISRLMS